jgi:hypothetical protein
MRQCPPEASLRGFPNLISFTALVCKMLAAMRRRGCRKEPRMLDVVMLAVGLGFFALSVGYAMACDRL